MTIKKNLILIFKKKFNLKISDQKIIKLSNSNFKKWDSLEHINLLMMVEKKFKIKMKFHEITELNSFHKIEKFLNK
ncbi:acyl carrier protein [Candidatus Pelagibacter sp.]|nr:acyl carrier protein [Candidatus Pelagibacter sp.]